MIPQESLLVTLVKLVETIPMPPPPPKRGRGRPKFYPDRLFLKALVIMIVRHLHKVHELLAVLQEPTAEMTTLRALLMEVGRYPCRRTGERQLKAIPDTLPAHGGVWHKKDRDKGKVPHTSIDTEAAWTKSGWHGWVYGWKLHIVSIVAAVWIPLAADLTPANMADNEPAPGLLREVPLETRFILGDHTTTPPTCGRLVTTRGASWSPLTMDLTRTRIVVSRCEVSQTAFGSDRELQRTFQRHL